MIFPNCLFPFHVHVWHVVFSYSLSFSGCMVFEDIFPQRLPVKALIISQVKNTSNMLMHCTKIFTFLGGIFPGETGSLSNSL